MKTHAMLRRHISGIMLSCVFALQANAQITVTDLSEGRTAQNLADAIEGPGVEIFTGAIFRQVVDPDPLLSDLPDALPNRAAGTFTGTGTEYGFSSGIILSSGRADNIQGTTNALSIAGNFNAAADTTAELSLDGDPLLEALYGNEGPGQPDQPFGDSTRLTFTFEPDAAFVTLQFVFASDEYNQYVGSPFNDIFGVFVNNDPENHAVVGVDQDPASINSINFKTNSQYHRNNEIFFPPLRETSYTTEANGMTTTLTCRVPVNANETNTMHLVIADRTDLIRDSWALIRAGSLTTTPPVFVTKTADAPASLAGGINGYTITLTNTGSSAATITSIEDLLPDDFVYRSGTTTGATTSNPAVTTEVTEIGAETITRQRLVWTKSGNFTVPANGTLTLAFDVDVSDTLGTYYNNADARGLVPVMPSYDTAPVEVKEAVDIEVYDPQGNKLQDGTAFFNFDGWIAGSSQLPRTFTIRNNGLTTNLTGLAVAVAGGEAADFVVDTTGMSTTLVPGASTTFTVRFKPSATSSRSTGLAIESSDPDEDPFNVTLTGYGNTTLIMVQEAYAKASNTNQGDNFGDSVAVWGDTVVVGATREDTDENGVNDAVPPRYQSSHPSAGAAYVFRRNPANGTWTQEAHLKASDASPDDWFGYTVAIHGDTIVVGAPLAESAYVFTRTGTTWTQQAILQAPFLEFGDSFGYSVDVFGETIAVGSPGDDSGFANDEEDISEPDAGAVHVFNRSGTTWSRQAFLKTDTPYSWDLYGYDVAIYGDTVVTGAIGWSGWTGYVGVHTRSGTTWTHQARISPLHLDSEDSFGESVDIWGDSIIIGAPGDDSYSLTDSTVSTDNDPVTVNWGAAYIYKRTGTTWAHQAFLKPSTYPIDQVWFGTDVSIAGEAAVVGVPGDWCEATGIGTSKDGLSAQDSGAAYVFTRSGTTWSEKAYVKASNTQTSDRFMRVGIHGETVVVGAAWEDSNATGINGNQSNNSSNGSGAAYFFELFD